MRFLKLVFFQTIPPNPIRGYLPRAIFNFSDFSRSYSSFKMTPQHPEHREVANSRKSWTSGSRESPVSGTPGSQEFPVSRTLGIRFFTFFKTSSQLAFIWDTRESFFYCSLFFKLQAIAKAFKAIMYQKSLCVFYSLYKYFWFMF